jgi:FMN phosphatase YigB (HAD superfamily)
VNTANAGNSPSVAPPRAVIFDIGRVIVRVNIARALAMVGGGAAAYTPEQIWSAIEADALWDDWEKGKVEPREWYRHLASKFDSPLDFDAFAEAWCSVLDPTPIIGDELFRELSARCRLGLLSNTDVLHVAYMEKNFSFVRLFSGAHLFVQRGHVQTGARNLSPRARRDRHGSRRDSVHRRP